MLLVKVMGTSIQAQAPEQAHQFTADCLAHAASVLYGFQGVRQLACLGICIKPWRPSKPVRQSLCLPSEEVEGMKGLMEG